MKYINKKYYSWRNRWYGFLLKDIEVMLMLEDYNITIINANARGNARGARGNARGANARGARGMARRRKS